MANARWTPVNDVATVSSASQPLDIQVERFAACAGAPTPREYRIDDLHQKSLDGLRLFVVVMGRDGVNDRG